MADLYKILGVNPEDDATILKRRYRALAKQLHPDHTKGDVKKTDRFKRVAMAYAILGNEQRRAAYDRQRDAGPRGTPGSVFGPEFDDLVERVSSEGIGEHNMDDLIVDFFDFAKKFQTKVPAHIRRAADRYSNNAKPRADGSKPNIMDVIEDLFGIETPGK